MRRHLKKANASPNGWRARAYGGFFEYSGTDRFEHIPIDSGRSLKKSQDYLGAPALATKLGPKDMRRILESA